MAQKVQAFKFQIYETFLASREWLVVYPTFTSPKEFVRDVFLENTLKRNSTKERLIRLPFLYI
jgi:hypothetical protein